MLKQTLASCLALLCFTAVPLCGAAPGERAIVITVDDLPLQGPQAAVPEIIRINDQVVEALRRHEVPAIGFVNEAKLERGGTVVPALVGTLETWLDAGLELGNHGYSHLDLHRALPERFIEDIERGERQTRSLMESRGAGLRFFRHPYLHTGTSIAARDQVRRHLEENGYWVAPVTIDNSEWIFAAAYREALGKDDPGLAKRVASTYVAYMEEKTAYYEEQTQALFGRSIPHTLLIHQNHLNAAALDALLAMYKERGYRFIGLDEAIADEAYASADEWTGVGGISWLHRWAITAGKKGEFFAGEPACP